MKTLAIALILFGGAMLFWTGFAYFESIQRKMDSGPIVASARGPKTINRPLVAGTILLVAGVVLLLNVKKGE
jgi:UPF0716 family protein affecting phage T7 exclusion